MRDEVKYVNNEKYVYAMQWYHECHHFFHALTELPVMMEGEIASKAFEFANSSLPITGLSDFAVRRLKSTEREILLTGIWALGD